MKSIATKHCRQDHLLLHYYGELNPQQRRELVAHLQDCASCAKEWRQLQDTLDRVPRPAVELAKGDVDRFVARVAQRAPRSDRGNLWLWGGALTAGAVLALSLTLRPPGMWPGQGTALVADAAVVQELDLLQNMDLLEELELLQELEGQG